MFELVAKLSEGLLVSSNPHLPEKYSLLTSILQSLDRYERRDLLRGKKALRLLSELQSALKITDPIQ